MKQVRVELLAVGTLPQPDAGSNVLATDQESRCWELVSGGIDTHVPDLLFCLSSRLPGSTG